MASPSPRPERLASQIRPDTPAIPELRQGRVMSVDTGADTVAIKLNGATETIGGCRTINPSRIGVDYTTNDWVWCLVLPGAYPLVLGGPV